MFWTIALAVYLLPSVYVYFRVMSLLLEKLHKIIFTGIFILFVSTFPATEILSHSSSPTWVDALLNLGYSSLPFMLYLFLLVVLLDILRGINRLLKIVPVETLRLPRIRVINLTLLIAVPTLVVAVGMVKFADIRVNEYQVQIPRKSSPLRNLKIALASDLHLKELTDRGFMDRFVTRVNSLNADILLMPGDILEGDRQYEQLKEFERQFRRIRTRYGVYASPGNHDRYAMRNKLDFFENSHITLLQDTVAVIDGAFTLVARNDGRSQSRKTIDELMRSATDTLPSIVLDHRPTDILPISATRADLLVCGHSHHGQLFPLNLIAEQLYELSWGYKKFQNTHVFVTSGVQLWGPPVRTAGDSEIMVITAEFTDG